MLLPPADACEVLRRVDELVRAQGGRCRNLSSILQSVCRKLERRSSARGADDGPLGAEVEKSQHPQDGEAPDSNGDAVDGSRASRGDKPSGPGAPTLAQAHRAASEAAAAAVEAVGAREPTARSKRTRRRRKGVAHTSESEGDAANANEEALPVEGASDCSDVADEGTADSLGRRMEVGSGPESDEEADASSKSGKRQSAGGCPQARDHWSPRRIERIAQRGFELKRKKDKWELKITMGGFDPPLTELGMERYCQWLRQRFANVREEHGLQALRRCCGEVDFSNNGLSDQAVWLLLDSLAQYDVHAASLKLYKNNIGPEGVLAICEFIRRNRRAGAVYEMHLSHNRIDDDAAYELLRTLHEQKNRYPPRRTLDGAEGGVLQVPVWVRLNHNKIKDPLQVLRDFEADGITFCSARNATGCGPGRCAKADCPLAHLYLFVEQGGSRREGPPDEAVARQDEECAANDGGTPSPRGAPGLSSDTVELGGKSTAAPDACDVLVDDEIPSGSARPSPESEARQGGSRRKRGRKSRHRESAEQDADNAGGGSAPAAGSPARGAQPTMAHQ